MAKSEIHLGSQNGQNYNSAVSSSSLQIGKLEKNLHNMECLPEVGNWPKKSNALALEIVSQKCNALVIMH